MGWFHPELLERAGSLRGPTNDTAEWVAAQRGVVGGDPGEAQRIGQLRAVG